MSSDWLLTELGSVVELKRGYDLPKSKRVSGDIPIISSSGISDTHAEAKVKAPGVVTGRYGTIGEVYYSEVDFWPLNTTLYVRDFKGNDEKFIYYFLKTIDYLQYSDKAAVPGVNRNHLHTAQVIVPSCVSEQKEIAHILGTLDDKIELNRQMNETMEAMSQALFKSWFVDFDPVIDNALAAGNEIPEPLQARAEKRQALGHQRKPLPAEIQSLFPYRFVFTDEMGWVPEGWEVRMLGEFLNVLETGRRPKGGVAMYDSGIPSVGAESINGIGNFEFGKTKYIPEEFYESMKSGYVESYDVLLYKDGGKPGDFKPRIGMYGENFPFEKFAINEHVFRLRSDELGQPFLYYQVGSRQSFHDLAVRGGKAAIPGVNQNDVKSLWLAFPDKRLIEAFNKFAYPLFKSMLKQASHSLCLQQTRDALLPKLLSGELRVPDAEKQVAEAL